jgi:hypothetical protein
MSQNNHEGHSLPHQFSGEQSRVLQTVAHTALETVDARYGSGYPNLAGSKETDLAYHNGHHARKVGEDACRVAMAVGFTSAESLFSETIGSAHDVVQLLGCGRNEEESAAWLAAELRRLDLQELAGIGSIAILGTEPLLEDGRLVGQKATELEYPSRQAERVALSVASGDLGELLTPQGPYMAHHLWHEIQGVGPNSEPFFDREKLINFQGNQIELQGSYQYPLSGARKVLATHETQVRTYSERVYEQLVSGDITSFRQLLEQDKAFMQQWLAD